MTDSASEERVVRRNKLRREFLKQFQTRGNWRFFAKPNQLKAGAKKAADMQLAREKRQSSN